MTQASYHDHDGHSHEGQPAGHGHLHGPGGAHHHGGSSGALAWAFGITVAFMVVEAVGGFLSHSLALLADAAHMLTDAGALALSLFAAWIVRQPAGQARTYGWYRAEILAALANGALLLAVTVGIIWEAVQRLRAPEHVRPEAMFVVATLGLAANLVAAAILHRSRGENLNIKGAYLHVLSDLAGSVAAMLAAAIIYATGWEAADPLLSLALSLLLVYSAWSLVRQAVDVLMEAAPPHVDMAALEAAVAAVPGVERVHDVHVWTVASGFVAMSGHAVVRDPAEAQGALDEITRRVKEFGVRHVTVQVEQSDQCESC